MTDALIPRFIRCCDEFAEIVTLGSSTESLVLEFKKQIDGWKAPKGAPERPRREAQKELCRDVAQFANTLALLPQTFPLAQIREIEGSWRKKARKSGRRTASSSSSTASAST
jgi:hypothetical protein